MKTRRPGCTACRKEAHLFSFTMAFQPVIDLTHNRIDAHEALVRGPEGESAHDVFELVTDQNLYAFDQACRVKAIELAARLRLDTQLNINFLPNAVYDPKACIRKTLDTAARTGFPLNRLTFEFTEQERIRDNGHILNIIDEYRRHGFKIALDDFGTAYSGLSRLADLKPDIIKLDRDLIKNIDQDRTREAIVANLVKLSRDLGLKVVAEGFERREEVETARSAGIRFMQGFYFARPRFEELARNEDIIWLRRATTDEMMS